MCDVMNKLQSQSFEINKEGLDFILKNRDRLVESGLLMPSFLASLNIRHSHLLMNLINGITNKGVSFLLRNPVS